MVDRGKIMSIQITTLVENSLGENLALKNEHGLSFFIQTGEFNIIFDTGQSDNFIYNANTLNIDLSKTTHVVLSHGHYDHSGGFKSLVQTIGNSFELVISPEFFNEKYAYRDMAWQYLGNNFDKHFLHEKNIMTHYIKKDIVEIVPNIFVVRNFERSAAFEPPNERFYIHSGGKYISDCFDDEVVIVINTKKGLVVLLGCSHPGVVNILSTIIKKFDKPIYGILGGTHLVEADDRQLTLILEYLEKINAPLLGISHCTGEKAVKELRKNQKRFFCNCTGTSIKID